MLSRIRAALHRARHGHMAARLLKPQFRIPKLQVFVLVAYEHEDANAIEGTMVRVDMGHGRNLLGGNKA